MEARVGVVVDGGQRALNSAAVHGSVVDAGARKFLQQHNHNHNHNHNKQQSLSRQAQIGTIQQLLAGGIAGAFSKTCTAPLARLTILFQVQGMHADVSALHQASLWREASRVIHEEGFRAFWKGNLVTIVHRLPYSSVNFYAYERYKSVKTISLRPSEIKCDLSAPKISCCLYLFQLLQSFLGLERQRGNATMDLAVHFIGGGLAGITAASATYPLDLVRTRLAAQRNTIYYRGMWHAFSTIIREEGFLGLYKGLAATLLGVGPSIALSFSVYESLRSFWQTQRPNDSTVAVSLACGSLSGIASSTATFPLDLVRRRMQLEGAGGRARVYTTGLFGTLGHIIRNEGLRGLYRGILPEYCKVVPSVGIIFMTYETLKMLLSHDPTNQ
ncbi:mitochondrial substrate carrier family protein B isoform X1 [Jatropha curcas]|uniref:mitochondrial substrate carrier family protein B isoform X1 n=1 Tax=Jatropha curcas TaxID=180498 RepID=UPI0009D74BA0|nr:mitochondrial substrate carrier family protein B isoform X1 [Jatropha curcas]